MSIWRRLRSMSHPRHERMSTAGAPVCFMYASIKSAIAISPDPYPEKSVVRMTPFDKLSFKIFANMERLST